MNTTDDVGALVMEVAQVEDNVLEFSKDDTILIEQVDHIKDLKSIEDNIDSSMIITSTSDDPKLDNIEEDLISKVKEEVLKEVEEFKNSTNLDSATVSAADIENLLEPKHLPQENIILETDIVEQQLLQEPQDPLESQEPQESQEQQLESNPQVNMEDMKAAQEELRVQDILVCGSCHQVVHYVDAFVSHKPLCKGKSKFHGHIAETKPQVWAFLLWKNAQNKLNVNAGLTPSDNSWKLYQKWCKMPNSIRETWVAAGETVMNFSTFGYSSKNGDALKTSMKKPEEKPTEIIEEDPRKPVVMRKLVQRDHAGEIKEIRPTSSIINKKLNEDIENVRNQLEDGDSSQDKFPEMDTFEAEPTRISFQKYPRVKPSNDMSGGIGLQEEEFVVEKIVSRRFNPRKKQYEYLLKWEGYPSEQNTWEPAENLEACQHLLKAFEDSLSKQSASKTIIRPPVTTTPIQKKVEISQPGPSGLNSVGRPTRYSKQKALNQVKAWCGSIKPDDAELETLKRRAISDSEDEDENQLNKRLRSEIESDSEDSLGGRIYYNKSGGVTGIIKKSGRGRGAHNRGRIVQNGTSSNDNLAAVLGLESSGDEGDGKKMTALEILNKKSLEKKISSLSPANQQVLVANAKGVVKVDHSQVPNLSSGVYIMSNKSGIIKLDSVSPSKALSLKQGPVKEMSTPKTPVQSQQGGVFMINKNHSTPGIQRTGILRRNSVTPGRGGSNALAQSRSIGRPPSKPAGNIKITNSNTRLLHSGAVAKATVSASPSVRPKLPLKTALTPEKQKKGYEIERRVLGSKVGGRGGFTTRGLKGKAGNLNNSINTESNENKKKDRVNVFKDLPQDSHSSDSDPGIPDDFPSDLPPIEPESPPRPLTLCPETGKVLLKAEGERTPEPTPPPSPVVREEEYKVPKQAEKKITKDTAIMKKSIGKPGSVGTVSISPKKITPPTPEVVEDDSEFVTITGEDGLLYRVSKEELKNTLLVGEDGQQCVYVTTGENGDENATVLTLGSNYSDVSQLEGVNLLEAEGEGSTQFYVKEEDDGELMSLQVQGEEGDDGQPQIVAQLVEAGEPAPGGGPRRVVLLLPDGNLMMTEVDEEQYAALELDKFQTEAAQIE